MKIMIVGCGNVGSKLAYMLALITNDNLLNLEELVLLDNDTLERSNLPYISIGVSNSEDYLGKPKVEVLYDIIHPICPNLKIEPIYSKNFISCINDEDSYSDSYFIIDCRDTKNKHKNFHMKLNIDGAFGLISTLDNELAESHNSRYVYGKCDLYSMTFASICASILMNMVNNRDYKKQLLAVDLRFGKVDVYDISPTKDKQSPSGKNEGLSFEYTTTGW